uniref:cyclin-dependent kinase 2-interacting protein-like n=1 Tax=Styela clava TaxID=7725 RepID=UPI00193A9631|nr:cyclin-dependent kinase 2-interacting protein-like [Styela clava]
MATPEINRTRRTSTTPKHGQLTGFPRRIKDCVADIHNAIQKWESSKNKGFNLVSDIANLKIASRAYDEASCYPNGLENMCSNLKIIYDNMENLCIKMNKITVQLQKIAKLNSQSSSDIYFMTWPASNLFETVKQISDMHKEELEAKKAIVESIAHVDLMSNGEIRDTDSSRDILMTYVACWLHEPFINEETRTIMMEELLLETGHHQ